MPAGRYDHEDSYIGHRSPYTPSSNVNRSYNGDESTASILKSVKAQEAQFEKLTRELEAERQSVAQQIEECRAGSETASMNSITSTDDSFHWHGPQTLTDSQMEDDSANDTKMSSHLLDSCLRELDNRGVMNAGYSREDNMDYMQHEDPYSSQGRIPYGSDPYNPHYSSGALNGGNPQYHLDERSPHSSHLSLQSAGSNRNPKMVQRPAPGSMGSLPHDQHDNYMSYSSLSRPQYEDSGGSPLQSGSPRGPGTPTRFNSYEPPYSSTQLYHDNSPRYSVDSNDSFHRQHYDSYNHYDPRDMNPPHDSYDRPPSDHGQPPYSGHPSMQYDPHYDTNSPYNDQPNFVNRDPYGDPHGDMDPHNDSRVSDSFYRDSPVGGRYDGPRGGPQMDPLDRLPPGQDMYGDSPQQDMYRDGPMRDHYDGPEQSNDRYNDPSFDDDRYRGHPGDGRHPDMSVPESSYRESPLPGDQYPQHPDEQYLPQDDRYRDQPPEDRFRDLSMEDQQREPPLDRYGEPPDDRYREPPGDDRYIEPPGDDRYREPPGDDRYRDGEPSYGDYDDHPYRQPDRKHDGLPLVPNDPFADDPFQRKASEQYLGPPVDDRYRDDDPYNARTPSPGAGSDQYGPYSGRPPQYDDDRLQQQPPYYDDDTLERTDAMKVGAPPMNNYPPSDGRRTPSDAGGSSWRNPDLQEVIDYLSHPSDAVKANAAAYLQHLCYNDDDMKAKAKGLDGIPPLIELLRSEYPEVQRNACGALKNLSYGRGRTGLDNKKAIENAGGITALIRLLRKAQDEDIKELVTGILWNLSTCEELKGKIITEGLSDIVSRVIVPYSGWERRGLMQYPSNEPWTMVFKNATGIIRNLSSAHKDDEQKGYEMRNKLRECSKLVNCLVYSMKVSVENHDKENKPVENCTCALRNLSFRIQEVSDRDFHKKRAGTLKKKSQPQKEKTGCFGAGGKKKAQQKHKPKADLNQNAELYLPPGSQEYQALWMPDVIRLYISILKDGSNPVTVEAAAGAIQNLTACYWQYAEHIRELVRKEKGLPFLVDLLTQESDTVVCHAALALRNLAIDEKNKELIGKHGMKQLISQLPKEGQNEQVPDRTICAVIATVHEVVKNNQDFAQAFSNKDGIPRLKFIKFSRGKFQQKTKDHTQTLIEALWEFKDLHPIFGSQGLMESDVKAAPTPGRMNDPKSASSNYNTPYSTMNRPVASQGYDDHTLSPPSQSLRPENYEHNQTMNGRVDGYPGGMVQGHSNPAMNESNDRYNYQDNRRRGDEIPMTDMGPGYAPIDDDRPRRTKPPVGGVPLFPNLQPQRQVETPPPQQPSNPHEPLYAQVNKSNKRRPEDMGPPSPSQVYLDTDGPQGGADSWV